MLHQRSSTLSDLIVLSLDAADLAAIKNSIADAKDLPWAIGFGTVVVKEASESICIASLQGEPRRIASTEATCSPRIASSAHYTRYHIYITRYIRMLPTARTATLNKLISDSDLISPVPEVEGAGLGMSGCACGITEGRTNRPIAVCRSRP